MTHRVCTAIARLTDTFAARRSCGCDGTLTGRPSWLSTTPLTHRTRGTAWDSSTRTTGGWPSSACGGRITGCTSARWTHTRRGCWSRTSPFSVMPCFYDTKRSGGTKKTMKRGETRRAGRGLRISRTDIEKRFDRYEKHRAHNEENAMGRYTRAGCETPNRANAQLRGLIARFADVVKFYRSRNKPRASFRPAARRSSPHRVGWLTRSATRIYSKDSLCLPRPPRIFLFFLRNCAKQTVFIRV